MSEEGSAREQPTGSGVAPLIIKLLITGLILSTGLLCLVASQQGAPEVATVKMVCGLITLWIVLGGVAMHHFRDSARKFIQGLPFDWRVKFTLFAIILALVEEAIAVLMTNLAPLLGVKSEEAHITASTSYLDVVLFHSVVVFVPLFIAWAVLLTRYDFSPFAVRCFPAIRLHGNPLRGDHQSGGCVFWRRPMDLHLRPHGLPTCLLPASRARGAGSAMVSLCFCNPGDLSHRSAPVASHYLPYRTRLEAPVRSAFLALRPEIPNRA